MKKLLALATAFALCPVANAATVFSDNFDANATGLNAVPTGWTVSSGTVDIIGNGFFDLIPGSGKYIDLDGSTSDAGVLAKTLSLVAGTHYTAFFDLAGNHRNGATETVTGIFGIGLGNVSATYSLAQNAGWTHYSLSFTPTTTQNYVLSFSNFGGDNVGMLLDNVSVVSTAPVPEPETYAMMLAGLGLLALIRRRRRIA